MKKIHLLLISFLSTYTVLAHASVEEVIENDESKNAEITVDFVLNNLMEKNKTETSFKRGFHNKANACLVANFEVFEDIPDNFKQGFFAVPKSFAAWVRYSNGSPSNTSDKDKQPRALAVKVLGTQGPMLQEEIGSNYSQDFLLANNPVFFLKSLNELVTDGIDFFNDKLFGIPFNTLSRFNNAATQPSNLLRTDFFSQSAYKLGNDQAVKYRLSACENNSSIKVDKNANNGIRVALYQGISSKEQCYNFDIQLREDVDSMPIENPTVKWTSEFTTVGQLTILQQGFNSTIQDDICEQLSFNPWHTIEAHRPLGALNRVRKMVYKLGSDKRRLSQEEPSTDSVEGFGQFYTVPELKGHFKPLGLFILCLIGFLRYRSKSVGRRA